MESPDDSKSAYVLEAILYRWALVMVSSSVLNKRLSAEEMHSGTWLVDADRWILPGDWIPWPVNANVVAVIEASMSDMLETDAACQRWAAKSSAKTPSHALRARPFGSCSLWPLFLVHVWSLFSRVFSDLWLRSARGNLERFFGGYLLRVMVEVAQHYTCASDWRLLLGFAASNTVSTLGDELLYAAPAPSVGLWCPSDTSIC